MTAFNPLTAILTQNKLEGPNYVDWKRNLDIVLIAEEFKFVLDEVCPEKPIEDVTDDGQKTYQNGLRLMRWRGVTFWHLCRMFCNINISSSVRDYVLKMMSLLSELEVFGANIDKDTG
ncbi:uncharacterized protein LOC107814002 [Nicotiana tabacum]|uniref:Uncharacterized protein LOC107814002 n=2 Tax=Nicotiana TaxID=4085 RepID=A0A1S4C0X6_TOBAC|nr:PREDICTED: uncharacterized protein LOC104248738 [Nicotiana sylvestris]XP_016494811.1 PREDICTED: uncharacterized protein LOC107814002 [Nicotiana tabacum]